MSRRDANEAERDYLKIIQTVIDRMARCSFLIKGWSITIVAAILALDIRNLNPWLSAVGFLPVLVFWLLDSYYLRRERLFSKLYEKAISELDLALPNRTLPLFIMNTKDFEKDVASWFCVVWSRTIWPLYLFLFLVVLVVSLYAIEFSYRFHFYGELVH
jgi:hypothetical protein